MSQMRKKIDAFLRDRAIRRGQKISLQILDYETQLGELDDYEYLEVDKEYLARRILKLREQRSKILTPYFGGNT